MKLPPRLEEVGVAVGKSVVRAGLEEAVVLGWPLRDGEPVGAADGLDVGANVKSRPSPPLIEGLIVGISTKNPVGAKVGAAVVLVARVLGAGEDVEYEGVVMPPLSCSWLLSKIGLGTGTPTETGGPVGVAA